MTEKKLTSLRISPEAKELLVALVEKLQLKQTGVIELAIRELAVKWGIK